MPIQDPTFPKLPNFLTIRPEAEQTALEWNAELREEGWSPQQRAIFFELSARFDGDRGDWSPKDVKAYRNSTVGTSYPLDGETRPLGHYKEPNEVLKGIRIEAGDDWKKNISRRGRS